MNKYETYIFKLEDENKLTNDIIINSINSFWDDIMIPLNSPTKQVSLIYRVIFYRDKHRVTLLKSLSFNSEELNLFQGLVTNLFEYNTDDNIKDNIVDKIIIKYKMMKKWPLPQRKQDWGSKNLSY